MKTWLVLAHSPLDMTRQVPLSSIPKFEACAGGAAPRLPSTVIAAAATPPMTPSCAHGCQPIVPRSNALQKGEFRSRLCENGAVRSIVAVLAAVVTAGPCCRGCAALRPPSAECNYPDCTPGIAPNIVLGSYCNNPTYYAFGVTNWGRLVFCGSPRRYEPRWFRSPEMHGVKNEGEPVPRRTARSRRLPTASSSRASPRTEHPLGARRPLDRARRAAQRPHRRRA